MRRLNVERTKASVIRNTRHAARILPGRTKVYSRIGKWEEYDIGKAEERYVVTLKEGWTFSEGKYDLMRIFATVAEAMRGVSLTYKYKAA